MRILYGVQTTGNGHICRSREVIRELKDLGHEVQVLFSGRRPAMQSELKEFEPYRRFRGLTFYTYRGQLKYFKTALRLNIFQVYRDIASLDDFSYDLITNISSLKHLSLNLNQKTASDVCQGIHNETQSLFELYQKKSQ